MNTLKIDPVIRVRLEQWARYQRGGLPTGVRTTLPENLYEGGQTVRKLSARGVATRAAVRVVTEEWPASVVEVNSIIVNHITRAGLGQMGEEIKQALLLYYSTDEGLRGVAAMMRKSRMTVKRRLDAGHIIMKTFLDSGTELA